MEPIDTMAVGGGRRLPVYAIDGDVIEWHEPTEVFVLNLWKVKHPTLLTRCIEGEEKFIIQNQATKNKAEVVYAPTIGKHFEWRVHEMNVPYREWGMRIVEQEPKKQDPTNQQLMDLVNEYIQNGWDTNPTIAIAKYMHDLKTYTTYYTNNDDNQ